MDEHACYHALATALEGTYHRLNALRQQCGTWRNAWEVFSQTHGAAPNPDDAWTALAAQNIRLVLSEDDAYPPLLREIPYPPLGIYVKGPFDVLRNAAPIAVVGTRNATTESKEFAREFAARLANAGCLVVSGLALGIDASAHRGALDAGGKTAAVLACGAEQTYPRLHEKLANEILACGGAIVSEYPPGSPPLPYRFLERNRIVSGLSRGVVIVEAPSTSGALVTARFATEQNRDVFVVPGPAKHPNFRGSHRLIQEGACLVTDPDDVLCVLGVAETPPVSLLPMEPDAEQILEALRQSKSPLPIDKIIELTTLNAKTANQTVTFLLMQGIIKENGGGYTAA